MNPFPSGLTTIDQIALLAALLEAVLSIDLLCEWELLAAAAASLGLASNTLSPEAVSKI